MIRFTWWNRASLVVVLTFLYAPIVLLIIYSFNESRLVTVWTGFSLRWYHSVFGNRELVSAAWNTLRVAVVSATVATVLGTLAGYALDRFGSFRGRTLFFSMTSAPILMPDVVIGLSLLLTFVSLGIDRGLLTVGLAHITFSMCYAAVVVRSRLHSFDRRLEEAARDLGAPPWRAFVRITLPLVAPAVAAAWLLSFTLSLDDLVIASFVTGPAGTTLPIKVYSQMRLGVSPEINAVCTILVGLVASGALAAAFAGRFRGR